MTIETIEIETSLAEFMLPGESKGEPPPLWSLKLVSDWACELAAATEVVVFVLVLAVCFGMVFVVFEVVLVDCDDWVVLVRCGIIVWVIELDVSIRRGPELDALGAVVVLLTIVGDMCVCGGCVKVVGKPVGGPVGWPILFAL